MSPIKKNSSLTFSEKSILESWQKNASAWATAIREKQIESREQLTNAAIIDAILKHKPKSVIDIGCGEGWLTHAIAKHNIQALGVDAVESLIEKATSIESSAEFKNATYAELKELDLSTNFDLAVCNFSLIGKESVENVFSAVANFLQDNGIFIVQTVHPVFGCGELPYRDGWREGSWDGFSEHFTDPAPWYFRTVESWLALFAQHDFQLIETQEPVHPQSKIPASILFLAGTPSCPSVIANKT